MLELTPAQLAAMEQEAAALDAEKTLRELNNLVAAIGAAFSKEAGRELERWRENLLELVNPKTNHTERAEPALRKRRS